VLGSFGIVRGEAGFPLCSTCGMPDCPGRRRREKVNLCTDPASEELLEPNYHAEVAFSAVKMEKARRTPREKTLAGSPRRV
jgi:hypothetical protein